jgi:hypothetical protein
MLYALDKAQILALLTSKAKNYKFLYKPDKIFLVNDKYLFEVGERKKSFVVGNDP